MVISAISCFCCAKDVLINLT